MQSVEQKIFMMKSEKQCVTILNTDYDIAPFQKKDEGREYLKRSNMRESAIWATETKIMATAKMF